MHVSHHLFTLHTVDTGPTPIGVCLVLSRFHREFVLPTRFTVPFPPVVGLQYCSLRLSKGSPWSRPPPTVPAGRPRPFDPEQTPRTLGIIRPPSMPHVHPRRPSTFLSLNNGLQGHFRESWLLRWFVSFHQKVHLRTSRRRVETVLPLPSVPVRLGVRRDVTTCYVGLSIDPVQP